MDLLEALRDENDELWSAPRLLKADILEAARTMTQDEARFLVDQYYTVQHYRITSFNQARAMTESGEPNRMLEWFGERFTQLEAQTQRVLDAYSQASALGTWARANVGIGPVLAAGLLAHLDADPPPTVGHWWSFAGLNHEVEWLGPEKARALVAAARKEGYDTPEAALAYCAAVTKRNSDRLWALAIRDDEDQALTFPHLIAALARRPWNARLKVIMWKIGVSMTKCSGRTDCLYGQLYKRRKAYEQSRNLQGLNAEQAATILATKRIGHDTDAYKHYSEGRLPPAHIQARSERWAVKIFLSHFHEAATVAVRGVLPPKPFAIARLGHSTWIPPMHMDLIPGWTALRAAMA